MSNRAVRRIAVPWRRTCAALPAFALIGAGVVLSASAAPTGDPMGASTSTHSPAIVVPGTALTMPADSGDPFHPGTQQAPEAPALLLPAGTAPGSSTLVALDSMGVPVRALVAYRQSASMVSAADPACHIDWALLAAIGRVESDHARFGGNHLDAAGVAQPGIIGIPLDGTNGTALITDTDGGLQDRDTSYDRAVGPMQFIPSTWRVDGVDAQGDGVKNPQDIADAAAATGVYLCSGPGDLSQPEDLRAAVKRYNASDSYVRTVTAIADAYRHGVSALPASDLPAANPASAQAEPVAAMTKTTKKPGPANSKPVSRSSSPTGPQQSVSPRAPATTAPAPGPAAAAAPPAPAIRIPAEPRTATGLPSPPSAETLCTVNALGVRTCTLAP